MLIFAGVTGSTLRFYVHPYGCNYVLNDRDWLRKGVLEFRVKTLQP